MYFLLSFSYREKLRTRGHAYFKDDRNFSAFFDPIPPLCTQNDVIVTNTDCILPNPPPPRLRSSLKYPPLGMHVFNYSVKVVLIVIVFTKSYSISMLQDH